MEDVIIAIRSAVAPDATPETRAAGIQACRAVIAALGATQGEPLAPPRPINVGPTAQALAAVIRTTPPDQLFDMLIAKLRSAVPDDAQVAAPKKINIPLVRIPTR
jgi:hypothetical protein